ncbi:MAG: hypothetical protein GW886_13260 [Rhodobacterales bacterium]|nr:hypothetical protein [Rhodobacterales bacterium]NCT13137.1 hypothetical protein [Rhodobacterales bacterium]
MQVLMMGRDYAAQAQIGVAMVERGFQVICAETPAAAEAFLAMQAIDVMILSEGNSGSLSLAVNLATGWCDPRINVILMTDRTGGEVDDLYALIPSLYSVIGLRTAPGIVAQLALAALEMPQAVMLRPHPAVAEDVQAAVAPVAAAPAIATTHFETLAQSAAPVPEPTQTMAQVTPSFAAEPAGDSLDIAADQAEWERLLSDIRAQRPALADDGELPRVTAGGLDETLPDWARPRPALVRNRRLSLAG